MQVKHAVLLVLFLKILIHVKFASMATILLKVSVLIPVLLE